MMNPMPMPSGPAEMPGGVMKAERHAPGSETAGNAKEGDSFASTLKAVHDQNRARSDSSKTRTDTTRGKQEELESENDPTCREGGEAADGGKPPQAGVMQEMPIETPNLAGMASAAGTEPAGDLESPPEEILLEGDVKKPAPQADGQYKKAGQAAKMGFAVAHRETAVEETVAAKPTPLGMTATPPKPAESPTTAADVEAPTVDRTVKPAGAVLQAAHDRPEAKNANGAPAPVQDAGEKGPARADNTAMAGEGDFGENDLHDAAKLAKLLPNRDTANTREDSQASNARPIRPEPSEMPSGRSGTGEGLSDQPKSSGGVGRETLLTAMNDDPHHAAPRQGSTDTALSFSTTVAAGRAEMSSPGTGPAATMTAADRFHQDNFHQLVERAVFAMRGEQSEARIALKPDQLGHVQMRIVTENHLVSIKILTESPVARDLIDASAHQLKSELQQQGLTVESIEVSVSDDQRDAYRGARQRESFLRHLASQGQRRAQAEDSHLLQHGLAQQRPGRGRAAGIDYFA